MWIPLERFHTAGRAERPTAYHIRRARIECADGAIGTASEHHAGFCWMPPDRLNLFSFISRKSKGVLARVGWYLVLVMRESAYTLSRVQIPRFHSAIG